MHRALSPTALVPPGLIVERVHVDADRVVLAARTAATFARCPSCDRPSTDRHSSYQRTLSNLPACGRQVVIQAVVRRFRCADTSCRTRIFAERLGDALAARRARRTSRLEGIVRHLGLALGGRPAAGVARRLMLPVRSDTLLRVVRRHARRPIERNAS